MSLHAPLPAFLGNEHEKHHGFKTTSFKHPLDSHTNIPKFPQGSERGCIWLGSSASQSGAIPLNPISSPPHIEAVNSGQVLTSLSLCSITVVTTRMAQG